MCFATPLKHKAECVRGAPDRVSHGAVGSLAKSFRSRCCVAVRRFPWKARPEGGFPPGFLTPRAAPTFIRRDSQRRVSRPATWSGSPLASTSRHSFRCRGSSIRPPRLVIPTTPARISRGFNLVLTRLKCWALDCQAGGPHPPCRPPPARLARMGEAPSGAAGPDGRGPLPLSTGPPSHRKGARKEDHPIDLIAEEIALPKKEPIISDNWRFPS